MAEPLSSSNGSAAPRSANGRTFTVLVCPHSGEACTHDHHAAVPITVAPIARVRELEEARDRLTHEVRQIREGRSTVFTIGDATLFGSQESVNRANATLAHLKQKASRSVGT